MYYYVIDITWLDSFNQHNHECQYAARSVGTYWVSGVSRNAQDLPRMDDGVFFFMFISSSDRLWVIFDAKPTEATDSFVSGHRDH